MKFSRGILLLAVCTACGPGSREAEPSLAPTPESPSEFVALFNGENFSGWEGNLDYFRVEQGAIVAGRLEESAPRNEFLCTTQDYGDFELRMQVRVSGDRANGGIQIRSRRVPNNSEVSGYQADVGMIATRVMLRPAFADQVMIREAGIGEQERTNLWGALYDESRRNRMLTVPDQQALERVYRRNEWNDYRIRARGAGIQIWVNDYQTADYTEQEEGIEATGKICLQIHSGPPAEVWHRDLKIKTIAE